MPSTPRKSSLHTRRFRITTDVPDFRVLTLSHGWSDLDPFEWSEATQCLSLPIRLGRTVLDMRIRTTSGNVACELVGRRAIPDAAVRQAKACVRSMLRLDEELEPFWSLCDEHERLRWAVRRRAGRILRAPSLFEDLMKLLMTTNCSWAATKGMVTRLVDALGTRAASGRKTFPEAKVCAGQDETFFRDVVRSGYRASSCVSLSRSFADGSLPEELQDVDKSTEELRSHLLSLAGFGPYAAGQALRLLGRYEDFALDSWCRNELKRIWNRRQAPSDKSVARHYRAFGDYRGLALWLDLTARWHA